MGTNQILIIGYVVIGVIAMVIFSLMSGNFYMGFATGLMLIIGAALGHEFTIRRDGFAKVLRGVVGLRETVDRAEGAVTRMKAEFDRTSNDARAARAAVAQLQSQLTANEEQIKTLSEKTGEGGGQPSGQTRDAMEQLHTQQQQTTEDIGVIQNAGNQLHDEVLNLQRQLAELQQQMQQMQSHTRDSIEQIHATVNAMMAAGGATAAAMPAPPPPLAEATPPTEPEPEQPATLAEPEQPATLAEPEQPAARTEPGPDAAEPSASAGDFTASVFMALRDQLGGLGDNPADASLRAVADGLIGDAVDLYVEPVVTLPERTPAFYECYGGVRGADGDALTIDQNIDMSGHEQFMGAIENALMIRCMERIETLDISGIEGGKCFYNVPGAILGDRNFFGGLLGYLRNRPDLAGRLVMEFTQSALMEHGEQAVEDLVQLQECGCGFSIDEITDLAIDFESLVGFGFRFAKVGSKFIRVQANTADDPESVRTLAKTLKDMEIDLIVETVETDLSLVELIAFDIAYGQGPLFGQPSVAQG
jgi:cyclic-di-GMP phosphodiesterase TipF (flagellum assembly factor)